MSTESIAGYATDPSCYSRELQYTLKALHYSRSACHLTCRKYCSQDPNWRDPLLLLEQWDGAGWKLIRDLAAGTVAAMELMKNKFCQV